MAPPGGQVNAPANAPAAAPTPEQVQAIPTETWLLDALLAHGQAVVNQIAARGHLAHAEQCAQILRVLAAARNRVDTELRSGIVIAPADALPGLQ